MNEQEMKARFQELLPWHVNGTLDVDQRRWVDEYLREHPEAKGELNWFESLQNRMQDNAPNVSDEIGMDKLFHRIRTERKAKAPSFMERVSELLGIKFTPALAMTAGVILAQAGIIGALLLKQGPESVPDFAQTRGVQTSNIFAGPFVQITFRPDATEQDIRALLTSVQGNIVSGPGQLGGYYVAVPGGKADEAAKKLQGNKAVESTSVVAQLPAVGN